MTTEPRLEHIPAPPIILGDSTGLVYCKRCGLLLAADKRPDLDPERKACRVVRIAFREHVLSCLEED